MIGCTGGDASFSSSSPPSSSDVSGCCVSSGGSEVPDESCGGGGGGCCGCAGSGVGVVILEGCSCECSFMVVLENGAINGGFDGGGVVV